MRFDAFMDDYYVHNSLTVEAQECTNLYPETNKGRASLIGTPGLTAMGSALPKTPIRGLWSGDGRLFAVANDTLYEVNGSGTVLASRSGLPNDGAPVQIFASGDDLLIIGAGYAYRDDGAAISLVELSPSTDDLTAIAGAFVENYYFVARPSSRQVNISAVNNGGSWSDTAYQLRDAGTDNLTALLGINRELWVFGSETTEVWRNTGDADFPFTPDQSVIINVGCLAAHTCAAVAGDAYWIGANGQGGISAYRARGYQAERISTVAIENTWRAYTMTGAYSFAYVENGHHFWCIVYGTQACWVFDATEGKWHVRGHWDGASLNGPLWKTHTFVQQFGTSGVHVVGHRTSGQLYKMSTDYYDDAGDNIRRIRSSPHFVDDRRHVAYPRFGLNMETGASIGGGAAPTVSLELSDDGGKSYGTARSLAADIRGSSTELTEWWRNGAARDRVFRVTITGKTKVAIEGAYMEAE